MGSQSFECITAKSLYHTDLSNCCYRGSNMKRSERKKKRRKRLKQSVA